MTRTTGYILLTAYLMIGSWVSGYVKALDAQGQITDSAGTKPFDALYMNVFCLAAPFAWPLLLLCMAIGNAYESRKRRRQWDEYFRRHPKGQ